jgi:hypothetical protein
MSSYDAFEDAEAGTVSRPDKPFWKLPLDSEFESDEKEILAWLNAEYDYLQDLNKDRFSDIADDLAWYKGVMTQLKDSTRDETQSKTGTVRVSSNDTYDLLQARAARLIKYRPAVAILPANDEHADKIGAKACKQLLDHVWYCQRFEDEQYLEIVKNAMSMGECYQFSVWNPDLGDLHPDYKVIAEQVDAGEKVPLLDENGKPEVDEEGQPIVVDREVRNGDVDHEIALATEVLLEPFKRFRDARYCFRTKEREIEEMKFDYQDQAAKIHPRQDGAEQQIFDLDGTKRAVRKRHMAEIHFYFKPCKQLPKGRYVVFTRDAILSNTVFPYSMKELPCERLTDDDLTGENNGRSFIRRVRQLVSARSKMLNMIIKQVYLCAHPKWMMPAGSAKPEKLGNDITIVQYKGPVEPRLAQMNPVSPIVFQLWEKLGDVLFNKANIGDTMRGEPPAGIKAFVALQFLDEQEQELFNELILKSNSFIKNVARKDLAVAGDYYEEDDQRMIRVLGKDQRYVRKFFDVSHLSKDYDIRIQNSSALPQSKGARTQTIIDLNKEFPGLIPQEQLVELLDLGQSDKFVNAITVSIRAAEAENEAMMDGEKVQEPEEFENHILHWHIHAKKLQEWSFKYDTPKEIQTELKDHLLATEHLMWEKTKVNPLYLQRLATLDGFPLLFRPDVPGTPAQPGDPAAPGATASPAGLPGDPAAAPPIGADQLGLPAGSVGDPGTIAPDPAGAVPPELAQMGAVDGQPVTPSGIMPE